MNQRYKTALIGLIGLVALITLITIPAPLGAAGIALLFPLAIVLVETRRPGTRRRVLAALATLALTVFTMTTAGALLSDTIARAVGDVHTSYYAYAAFSTITGSILGVIILLVIGMATIDVLRAPVVKFTRKPEAKEQ